MLFYGVLEDTDLTAWTLDLYATRTLTEMPQASLTLLLGLRNADFDNDYRAVVGVQGTAGSRLDASSNYGRMMGPLLGLAATGSVGRHMFAGHLGQSVVFGDAELSSSSREFTGPFTETPSFFAQETFREERDVAIPITELRFDWAYDLTDRWSLGVGAETSAWWGRASAARCHTDRRRRRGAAREHHRVLRCRRQRQVQVLSGVEGFACTTHQPK